MNHLLRAAMPSPPVVCICIPEFTSVHHWQGMGFPLLTQTVKTIPTAETTPLCQMVYNKREARWILREQTQFALHIYLKLNASFCLNTSQGQLQYKAKSSSLHNRVPSFKHPKHGNTFSSSWSTTSKQNISYLFRKEKTFQRKHEKPLSGTWENSHIPHSSGGSGSRLKIPPEVPLVQSGSSVPLTPHMAKAGA